MAKKDDLTGQYHEIFFIQYIYILAYNILSGSLILLYINRLKPFRDTFPFDFKAQNSCDHLVNNFTDILYCSRSQVSEKSTLILTSCQRSQVSNII